MTYVLQGKIRNCGITSEWCGTKRNHKVDVKKEEEGRAQGWGESCSGDD